MRRRFECFPPRKIVVATWIGVLLLAAVLTAAGTVPSKAAALSAETAQEAPAANTPSEPTTSDWTLQFGERPAKDHVDFCCCSASDVNKQAPELMELLNSIVRRPFFRFIKVDVHRPCPYYAVNLLCTSAHAPCTVCKCDADDVPQALRDADISSLPDDYSDEPLIGRSKVPRNVGTWGGDAFSDFASDDDHNLAGDNGEFVDLVANPEGHTGYSGPFAQQVWDGVYQDNCLPLEGSAKRIHTSSQRGGDGAESGVGSCSESRVLYRLVSGLHASISTHIALTWNAYVPDAPRETNCSELRRRVLDHPDRVENAHMLYQFVLRALTRAADTFTRDPSALRSGDKAADDALWEEIQKLFRVKLLCSNTFNETLLLGHPQSRELLAAMRKTMANMSTLTDCISCEKCRVWGKLQFLGLATALKVVTHPVDAPVLLPRNEMVALINLLRQLSVTMDALSNGQCDATGASGQQRMNDGNRAALSSVHDEL